jgi:hypothetical protein
MKRTKNTGGFVYETTLQRLEAKPKPKVTRPLSSALLK